MKRRYLPHQGWSADEEQQLREMVSARLPKPEIARRLGRTMSSVNSRCFKLGIRFYCHTIKSRAAEVKTLLAYRPRLSDAEIARRLGMTRLKVLRIRKQAEIAPLNLSQRSLAGHKIRPFSNQPTTRESEILELLKVEPLKTKEITTRFGRVSRSRVLAILYKLRKRCLAFCEGHGGGHPTTWYSIEWWLANNPGVAHYLAGKIYCRNKQLERDEIKAQVELRMLECVRTFRPGKGAKFMTYAIRCAYHAASEWCVMQKNHGIHVPHHRIYEYDLVPAVSVGMTSFLESGEDWEPASPPPDHEFDTLPAAFWEEITACLPVRLKNTILAIYRDGMRQSDYARTQNRSRELIRQHKEKALEQIRNSPIARKYEVFV